jgi:hypothetical protein
MIPLYCDTHFSFGFDDDRVIPKFHLEGVGMGVKVDVFHIDPVSRLRLELLTSGVTGVGGWVDLVKPVVVRVGDAFVAVPESSPR